MKEASRSYINHSNVLLKMRVTRQWQHNCTAGKEHNLKCCSVTDDDVRMEALCSTAAFHSLFG